MNSQLYVVEYDQGNGSSGIWPFSISEMTVMIARNVELMKNGIRSELIPVYQGTEKQCGDLVHRLSSTMITALQAMRLPTPEEIELMSQAQLMELYERLNKRPDARTIFGSFGDQFKFESQHNTDNTEN